MSMLPADAHRRLDTPPVKLPAVPFAYVYEWFTPCGTHQDLYPGQWNGRQPDRTTAVYSADQLRQR